MLSEINVFIYFILFGENLNEHALIFVTNTTYIVSVLLEEDWTGCIIRNYLSSNELGSNLRKKAICITLHTKTVNELEDLRE